MNYHECVRKWLQNNPGAVYDNNAFIEVFAEVQKKAMTIENAVGSFWHSKIYPWNPTKVDDKKLVPAELFKKDPMPNVNVSLNKGRGDEESTHQEEASSLREAESEQAQVS